MKYFQYLGTILLLCLFTFSCKKEEANDNIPADIPETLPAIQTAVSVTVNANCGGLYKALPARYDSTSTRYPLLVFIHGIGELGNGSSDLSKLLSNPVPARLKNKQFPVKFTVGNKNFSFIVVSPQFKNWPSPTDVDAVIKYAVSNLRIDTTRIYIAGMSMGGGATWDYAVQYAAKLAAIVPICGASAPGAGSGNKIAAANLPVWAFHNTDDGTVSVSNTLNFISAINAEKPAITARQTIWPTGGHDAWTKATDPSYKENGMNVYEWMLQYSREKK